MDVVFKNYIYALKKINATFLIKDHEGNISSFTPNTIGICNKSNLDGSEVRTDIF